MKMNEAFRATAGGGSEGQREPRAVACWAHGHDVGDCGHWVECYTAAKRKGLLGSVTTWLKLAEQAGESSSRASTHCTAPLYGVQTFVTSEVTVLFAVRQWAGTARRELSGLGVKLYRAIHGK